jgi:hypothetical protein
VNPLFVRTILFFLFVFSVSLCTAQIEFTGAIHVKVLDAETNKPLPYASVYLNRTTIGGYTDDKGEIDIKKVPFGAYDLVYSVVGYKSRQTRVIVKGESIVYLTVTLPLNVLSEVEVKSKKDDKWNRQLVNFEKLFFGPDHYDQCKIINPWVLDFKNSQGDFLAEAKEPLRIENNFLGYKLTLDIKKVYFNNVRFLISTNARFEAKDTTDTLVIRKWKVNRASTYRGSAPHFLKSLINNTYKTEGFDIYTDISGEADITRRAYFLQNFGKVILNVSFDGKIEKTNNGMYSIKFPERLEVHYLRKRAKRSVYTNVMHAVSWMEVKNSNLVVNASGIVQNPDKLDVIGNMGYLRVADWLPSDYQPADALPAKAIEEPGLFTDLLLEKPYIQTDRNYYYNRETIYMKGYMNYYFPLLRDSLSHSVYVDLANSEGRIIQSKLYPVDTGTFKGDFYIEPNIKPGLYQIKAYTQWMLNFNPDHIFTKTISILNEKEAVRMVSNYSPVYDTTSNVKILTDKENYNSRDMVIVSIDVLDSLDISTAADLSISVTDVEQNVPQASENTIINEFDFDNSAMKDSLAQIKFQIQYGIDFKGQFRFKNKPTQGIITVFQDSLTQSFGIITDDNGRFVRIMTFVDTAKFYLDAATSTRRKGLVVMDSIPHLPVPALNLEPLKLDVYSSENIRHDVRIHEKAIVLKEAEIKATKIDKEKPKADRVYLSADYVVTGDWLKKNNIMDVTTALTRKVPGMSSGRITLGTPTGFGGASPPLIVVDGVPQVAAMGDDIASMLNDIPIRSVERIEILKNSSAASFGSRGANGVIAIYTKKGNGVAGDSKDFDKSKLQSVTLMGYSPINPFTSPDYSKAVDNNYFDYRPTLTWQPNVSVDGKKMATVTFYAADAVTKYRIVVEGVTKDGKPVRGEKIISVVTGK